MARVITYSQTFPSNHPRKGEQTRFPEKVYSSLLHIDFDLYSDYLHPDGRPFWLKSAGYYYAFKEKHHTFRAGFRWKVGDIFSPRIWTGLPYRSPQRQFAPDLEIKKIWTLEFDGSDGWYINGRQIASDATLEKIANNDGLDLKDFRDWFLKPIKGQLICWNEKIDY